jgi:hypothetical protein
LKLGPFELGKKRPAAAAPVVVSKPTDEERRLARKNDPTLGVRHEHAWVLMDTLPRLQSAHDAMRWDVSKSRLLAVSTCTICGEYDRASARECAVPDCTAHPICERPYR